MKAIKRLLTVVFFSAAVAALAQDYSGTVTYPYYSPDIRNFLTGGIKIGFNNSSLYDTKSPGMEYNPLFGPVFGGYLSIPLNTYLGVQPELLYSEKGFSGQGTSVEGQYSFIDRMNFMDLPLMLQIKPSPYLYLLGGPEYSCLISRNYAFMNGVTGESTQQALINDNMRRNIIGFIAGADLNYARLALGGRVAWDLQDNNNSKTSVLPRYRNFWGQLTLGYRI